jgi:hypothetical protein
MAAYEQKVEPPDRKWQYLLFAAEPYETIAFKVLYCEVKLCPFCYLQLFLFWTFAPVYISWQRKHLCSMDTFFQVLGLKGLSYMLSIDIQQMQLYIVILFTLNPSSL